MLKINLQKPVSCWEARIKTSIPRSDSHYTWNTHHTHTQQIQYWELWIDTVFVIVNGTLFVLFICLCSKYIKEKKVLSGICSSDLSFSIVGVQFINASMFLGESDSWLFYYILSPHRHSQHIAPCIRPVLMLDIWDTFHWYAFTCTDCPLCTCAHYTGLDSVSWLRPESFPYIIWDSCQCIWVCPHPESIRGQFHPAPQCRPTLSQLGHRELHF